MLWKKGKVKVSMGRLRFRFAVLGRVLGIGLWREHSFKIEVRE